MNRAVDTKAIEAARSLLGITKFDTKNDIKSALWRMNLKVWGKDTPENIVYRAAQKLLLDNYVLDDSPEAKAYRAQKKCDEEIIRQFHAKKQEADWAMKLVGGTDLAKVRREFIWRSYQSQKPEDRVSFIRANSSAFDLTKEEAEALKKEKAQIAAKTKAEADRKAELDAAWKRVWQEKDEAKRKELRKAYRELTKPERQAAKERAKAKKEAAEKALKSAKVVNQDEHDTARHEAAHAVVALSLGVDIAHAHLGREETKNIDGTVSISAGHVTSKGYPTSNHDRLCRIAECKAGAFANARTGYYDDMELKVARGIDHKIEHGLLAEVCRNDVESMKRLDADLSVYAKQLVDAHWDEIEAVADALLMKKHLVKYEILEIMERTQRKKQRIKARRQGYQASLFSYSDMMMPRVEYKPEITEAEYRSYEESFDDDDSEIWD